MSLKKTARLKWDNDVESSTQTTCRIRQLVLVTIMVSVHLDQLIFLFCEDRNHKTY